MPGKRVASKANRRGRKGLLALLAAGGVLVLVVGWSVNRVLSDDADDVESSSPSTTSPGSGDKPSTADPSTTEGEPDSQDNADKSAKLLKACVTEVTRAEKAASAAKPGVTHWKAHVKARTDMLAGRISEAKMNAVWDRTKAKGPADVHRFELALDRYHGMSRCHALHDAPELTQALVSDCVARSDAASSAVDAAQATVGDWKDHLHHMADYADGGMSSGTAMRLWVKAWRRAPENISKYRSTSASLREAPTCSGAQG